MTFHVIIPARYASRRLPGKPLLEIDGKPMIQRVVECAARSAARSVTVATDDARIERTVKAFGGEVVMTAAHHPSGTDRLAEAAELLGFDARDIIVNVQGDEPEMPPALIDQVAELLAQRPHAVMATASAPLDDPAQLTDSSVVKVVTDRDGNALYFSRAAITAARRHLGIYAYRCDYLKRFSKLPVCELEKHEKLEQLRALWNGDKIACADAIEIPAPGIDTPADLKRIRRNTNRKRSKLAIAAGGWGAVWLLLAIAALPLKSAWPKIDFQWLFLYGALLGSAALPLGIAALLIIRRGLRRGASLAWLGCIAGSLMLAAILAFAYLPH